MTAPTRGKHGSAAALVPAAGDVRYYNFLRYVSKQRMVTFWYQLAEIMQLDVKSILEVGIGPRIVPPVLRELGKEVKTADVNPALEPDYLVPVQRLSSVVPAESVDLILCARVLHYVPPDELDQTFAELHRVTRRYVIITLPVDELRLSFGSYITSRPWHWASIRFPLALKRALLRLLPRRPDPTFGETWKLEGRAGLSCADFEARTSKLFTIEKSYAIPEVTTHHLYLLSKRAP
jgi:hypothetical protein